jgi:hypothetical protein
MRPYLAFCTAVLGLFSLTCAGATSAHAEPVSPPAHRIRLYGGTVWPGLAYSYTIADRVPIEVAGGFFGAGAGHWSFVQGRLGVRFISSEVAEGTTGFRTSLLAHGGLLHTRFSGSSDGYEDHHNALDAIFTADVDLTYIGTSGTGISFGLGVGVAAPLSEDIKNSVYKTNPPNKVRPFFALQVGYAF